MPIIEKAAIVRGKSLVFRDATINDASFILSLRVDELKARYLSATSNSLEAQVRWLDAYRCKTGEAYFIIESLNGEPLGTVRLYDARESSFCWGSWIVKEGAPVTTAVESALMVYAYGMDILGFTQAHFKVRKDNTSVCRFHERFGAARTGETAKDYLYELLGSDIAQARKRFGKFLPNALLVE